MHRIIGMCVVLVLALPSSAAAWWRWPGEVSQVSSFYEVDVNFSYELNGYSRKRLYLVPTPSMIKSAIREEVPATLFPFGPDGPECATSVFAYISRGGLHHCGFSILCDREHVVRAFVGYLLKKDGDIHSPLREYVQHKIAAERMDASGLPDPPYEIGIPPWMSLDKATQQAFIQFFDTTADPVLEHWERVVEIVTAHAFRDQWKLDHRRP